MTEMIGFVFGILFVLAVASMLLVLRKMKKKKLTGASKAKVSAAWKHAVSMQDPVRRVLEGDKVLDTALFELGYKGPLGEKLKKAGPRFSDVQAVWRAHKLRNTLAHETGAHINDAQAAAAMKAFERAINDLS